MYIHKYVSKYVCMYACMYVCMYAWLYVCEFCLFYVCTKISPLPPSLPPSLLPSLPPAPALRAAAPRSPFANMASFAPFDMESQQRPGAKAHSPKAPAWILMWYILLIWCIYIYYGVEYMVYSIWLCGERRPGPRTGLARPYSCSYRSLLSLLSRVGHVIFERRVQLWSGYSYPGPPS